MDTHTHNHNHNHTIYANRIWISFSRVWRLQRYHRSRDLASLYLRTTWAYHRYNNPPYQHIISTYPIKTLYQPTLQAHLIIPLYPPTNPHYHPFHQPVISPIPSPGIPSPTLAPSDRALPAHAHAHGPATTFGGGGGGYKLGGGSGSSSGGGASAGTATGTSSSTPQDRPSPPPSSSVAASAPPPLPDWMPVELCEKALELYAQRAAALSSKCFLQMKLDGKRTKDPFQGARSSMQLFPVKYSLSNIPSQISNKSSY